MGLNRHLEKDPKWRILHNQRLSFFAALASLLSLPWRYSPNLKVKLGFRSLYPIIPPLIICFKVIVLKKVTKKDKKGKKGLIRPREYILCICPRKRREAFRRTIFVTLVELSNRPTRRQIHNQTWIFLANIARQRGVMRGLAFLCSMDPPHFRRLAHKPPANLRLIPLGLGFVLGSVLRRR